MTPLTIAKELARDIARLAFSSVEFVYNPLDYAWAAHADYLGKYGNTQREFLFLGMNPGPWGMAQTGVPFGHVGLVRDWLKISGEITRPKTECVQKPVLGWNCARSEVSGKRFWGWAQDTFSTPQNFFKRFMVLNYCPLLFLDEAGRNVTPDKLTASEKKALQTLCDASLKQFIDFYTPKAVIGVGGFAEACLKRVVDTPKIQVTQILHPSPASPKANAGWAKLATKQLQESCVWVSKRN